MLKRIWCISIFFIGVWGSYLQAHDDTTSVGFSSEFLTLATSENGVPLDQNSHIVPQNPEPLSKPLIDSMPKITANTVHNMIHALSGIYAIAKIVMLHRSIYGAPAPKIEDPSLARMQALASFLYIPSIHNTGRFIVGSGGIIVQTLLYKTLAHVLVICATKDLVETIEDIAVRTTQFARRLIGF